MNSYSQTIHRLRRLLHALGIAALLAGLLPPPLVRSLLPEPVAAVAETTLLPKPSVAKANVNPGGTTATQITGTVFEDFNSNGVMNTTGVAPNLAIDRGVAGVTVRAYVSGSLSPVATAITSNSGAYTLTGLTSGTQYRVEFTQWPSGYFPSAYGSSGSPTIPSNDTSVQFVTAGTSNVSLGLLRPNNYCQNNPDLCLSIYRNGSRADAGVSPLPALLAFASTTNMADSSPQTVKAPSVAMGNLGAVGAIGGLAYKRSTHELFAAAVVRRHVDIGPGGYGAIYVKNTTNTAQPTLFATIPNAGTVTGRDMTTLTAPSRDTDAYDKVGKVGLGDIDLAEDEKTLYVVNLNDRKLYAVDLANPTNQQSFTIPNPGCGGGQHRPWALKAYAGSIYVGVICDAESSNLTTNLSATVYRFDPGAQTFNTLFAFPLTYPKGPPLTVSGCTSITGWFPWTPTMPATCETLVRTNYGVVRPQPILTDIEFDAGGSLILGFADRLGLQTGTANYTPNPPSTTPYYGAPGGDTLRVYNNNGAYVLENNGSAGPNTSAGGVGNGQGPGNGEFYYIDRFNNLQSGLTPHHETSLGALALLMGSNNVFVTHLDPLDGGPEQYASAGVVQHSNSNGTQVTQFRAYDESDPGSLGKANGLGDVELLCDAAPLEIGNRVWRDDNGDGIQDPGEPGIQDVTVNLYQNGVQVGTARTNATGFYYFVAGTAADPNPTDNTGVVNGGITPGTGTAGGDSAYEVRIPNISGGSKQAALGNNVLTAANNGGATDGDLRDSDGTVNGVDARYVIPYADLAGPGYNNHNYDFGFGPQTTGTIQIVKNTVGNNGTFAFTSADPQLDAVSITTVGNTGNSGTAFTKNAGSYTLSEDAPPANWALTSLSCTGDSDNGSVVTLASRQVQIDLDANENIICIFTNTYTPPPPSYTLRKTRITPDPVSIGDDITFTIQITNTGSTPITLLPLRDLYDTSKLLYLSANVLPDDSTNDGQLDWSDLTVSFGQDLAPGANFTVNTVFVARNDTTLLPGGATVNWARVLITGTPPVSATVRIEAPTAVNLAERRVTYTDKQVSIHWRTENEAEVSSFNLIRVDEAGNVVKVNAESISAQKAGQSEGAVYSLVDSSAQAGERYRYVLEVTDLAGTISYNEVGEIVTGSRLNLPLIRR